MLVALTDKFGGLVCLVVGITMLASIATVPLTIEQQFGMGIAAAVIFFIANRFRGQRVTLFLATVSLAMSARYIYWRATQTLTFQSTTQLILGSLLVSAEFYAVVVLILGYMQTAWPLSRKPVPLPEDPSDWPTVDVYIPTYNESLSVVRATVLACRALDYPADKFKVYILDDGRRQEFRRFATEAGVGYITRSDNAHAKAGNLNHAMTVTKGDFIAIFDCDHIPTRAFLQLTMGWLHREQNLAMVQTPHHFYSPDPFQRNLAGGMRVPPEGCLFYGLLQDGNDFWGATFFCGSCAVIRRAALDTIGGFATETVTEDAHTMLKLHRKGWNSGYLKIPLAAGLATERLILHIGQRIRWARGMMQILRIDNPLLGPGLSVGQRLCYFNAMIHFYFAVPRVIFLTSPLAYLLLGQNMIAASPLAIVAYALPHIFHSIATASRLHGNRRHSFWSEIYETVLALFLVRVTIATLLSPRRGKFNVTDKGGMLAHGYFDIRAVYPNIILALVVGIGIGRGLFRLIFEKTTVIEFQALLLNTIWATISLLIVLAALAIGRERQQTRRRARIDVDLPAVVHLGDGRVLTGKIQNLSQSGARAVVQRPDNIPEESAVLLEVPLASGPALIPSRYLRWQDRAMFLKFEPETLDDEAAIVQTVFGRADAWVDWLDFPPDRPLVSLWRVFQSIGGLFRLPDQEMRPGGVARAKSGAVPSRRAAVILLLAVAMPALGLFGLAMPSAAWAQTTTIRPLPQASDPGAVPLPTIEVPPTAPKGAASGGPSAAGTSAASATPAATPQAAGASVAPAPAGATQTMTYSLKELGASGQLALRGTSPLQGLHFGVRGDQVVTDATLQLNGALSPALLPDLSNITVTLNDQYVGTIPVNQKQPNFTLALPINPVFFQGSNILNFHLTGQYTRQCNDPLSGLIWGTIYNSSTLSMTVQNLPPQRDLSQLPMPFFDKEETQPLVLPFIVPHDPNNETLQAAGILASWFGQIASFRGASFPVSETPPTGNAVMLVAGGDAHLPRLPPITGPGVALIPNPSDPYGTLLVVYGQTGEQVIQAATALVLGYRSMGGASSPITPVTVPTRKPYDAPAWIPSDHPVRLGSLTDVRNLTGSGYNTLVQVTFNTPPDLYTWNNRGFPLQLSFRAPPGPIEDLERSRLDVGINGTYLQSIPMAARQTGSWWRNRIPFVDPAGPFHTVYIPPYDVFGTNALQFFFDTKPLNRGNCVAVPSSPSVSIDPNSMISLGRAYHFATMPNLAYFASSGFPFSRMADLSNTAVVLPDTPVSGEISAFLRLMGRFGYWTGYPVLRVTVARAQDEQTIQNDDILVIGTIAHLGSLGDIMKTMPVSLDGGDINVKIPDDPLGNVFQLFGNSHAADQRRASATVSGAVNEKTALLVSGGSPWGRAHTVVALLAGTPQGLDRIMSALANTTENPFIQGDLSLVSSDAVTSYRLGPTYTVGSIPIWMWPSFYFRDQLGAIFVAMLFGCVVLSFAVHRTLKRRAERRVKTLGARH
jgi:cellulose synthase (UDP-forming)